MAHRVLFGCFGSGGDLFPLVPVALRLRDLGHDVRFVTPRPLGLYLRVYGIPTFAYGDAHELGVQHDQRLLSARFGGWSSNRDIVDRYVAPGLADDIATVGRCLDDWQPEVVVLSSFAAPVRVAAARRDLPTVETSIYPQYWALEHRGRRFAHRYVDDVVRELSPGSASGWGRARAGWGIDDATVLLHEAALVPGALAPRAMGYPYWDGDVFGSAALPAVEEWIEAGPDDVVAITLGSFIGRARGGLVARLSAAVRGLGLRALVVNAAPGHGAGRDGGAAEDHRGELAVGFVPLAAVLPRVRAVVHHGGLGTSIAALRAGRPAVVVAQAFDQPSNGAVLEAAGAARVAGADDVHAALRAVTTDDRYTAAAESVRGQLSAPGVAVERAAAAVLDALAMPRVLTGADDGGAVR